MLENPQLNPAEIAAEESFKLVIESIETHKNFRFEAGAGAGKTYSLKKALKYLITKQGKELLLRDQKIACITYTNVAKDEIKVGVDNHPAILSETIHSFCWSLLKNFQPHLRVLIPTLSDKWKARIEEVGGVGTRIIKYDFGYPKVDKSEVLLHHDDVLVLMVALMKEPKFRRILTSRYPIIFIDEYQDTDKDFADALRQYFVETGEGSLIGFFGDHWQKIYGNGCGKIEHSNLTVINKKANFRSEKLIVECLNRIRKELPQEVCNPLSQGFVIVYHTNRWSGPRRPKDRGGHWEGDLMPIDAHKYLDKVQECLRGGGWDLSPGKTKILMLTHNVLANEQGYPRLAEALERPEYFVKKENDYIEFFVDLVEPVCMAYENKRFGEMFALLDKGSPSIRRHSDKLKWAQNMDALIILRQRGTIGEIIERLKETQCPRLSSKVEDKEDKLAQILRIKESERQPEDGEFLLRVEKLKAVSYHEVIALARFINDKTPFATKHGVKGAEFENVLVVCGRGWNKYNFNQMLEWCKNGIPPSKEETFERNRNLFYVACSRPQKKLALLFTQKLSSDAMDTLKEWFGEKAICSIV